MNFKVINNIKCYAPELAFDYENFPSDGFDFLHRIEENHFWFLSRNNIIKILISKFTNLRSDVKLLEIGCGTGFVLKGIQKAYPDFKLMGADIHIFGIIHAQKRLPDVEFIQMDATQIPFKKEFDVIGAFDVLEHIEQDQVVMGQVYHSLKNGGLFFVTVPQYQWMWSLTDDLAFHKRRYHRKELIKKLENAGFEILFISSFVSFLFPIILLSRLLKKKNKESVEISVNKELELHPILNLFFKTIMKFDEFLIRLGISLPFGSSLISVAKKN